MGLCVSASTLTPSQLQHGKSISQQALAAPDHAAPARVAGKAVLLSGKKLQSGGKRHGAHGFGRG